MAVECMTKLVDTLRAARILDEGQWTALRNNGTLALPPRALLQYLIQTGWLTPFQANLLASGRGEELSIGPHLLLQRLGKGGAGEVFKARHRYLRRFVALKIIRQDQLADEENVLRFRREIKLASQLNHPNVVHAFDAGPINDTYFLAMEYVEGTDLAALVEREGRLAVPQACDYIRQAAAGLYHAHQQGLVHRDVKPSNFLVSRGAELGPWGLVKLLDLGLARLRRSVLGEATNLLTPAGVALLGTPDFMSPEQAIDFHHADNRSDIYSLGCTLYFLLAGQPPFGGGSLAQKVLRHQCASPPLLQQLRSDVPPALDDILRRMMAKSPEDRYQSVDQTADALASLIGPSQSAAAIPQAIPLGPIGPHATADIPQAIPLGTDGIPPPGSASPSRLHSWRKRLSESWDRWTK
jgi:serine/threonine protein kinase